MSTALPERFSVSVHERAESVEYPSSFEPVPFSGWVVGHYDLAAQYFYGYRSGQAEPGDVTCSELLVKGTAGYAREASPTVLDPAFESVEGLTFESALAELDSIPLRFADWAAYAPRAAGSESIDVQLDARATASLIDRTTTLGLAGASFVSGRLQAGARPDGLIDRARLVAVGDGDEFSSLVIEITVESVDGLADTVNRDTSVAETGACDSIATAMVGDWLVRMDPEFDPLGTLSIAGDGTIALDVGCYRGTAQGEILPFGLGEVHGFDPPTDCDDAATELVRILNGDVTIVMVNGALALASPASSAIFLMDVE